MGGGLLLAGQWAGGTQTAGAAAPSRSLTSGGAGKALAAGGKPRLLGYAFGSMNRDVTIFDVATLQPLETRPLGATVRWLEQEQRFWDGQHIWTYDFTPDNIVQTIAIDPSSTVVVRAISTGGRGPAHGVEVLPEAGVGWVNIAGDDVVMMVDLEAGEVVDQVGVNDFPCDIHLAPGGRFGFTPERDADTVSKFDIVSRRVVKTVPFPAGSRPYMLRVSPDGRVVWVQTAGTNLNVVLDSDTLEVLQETPLGTGPVTNAFQPDGPYGIVTHTGEPFVAVLDAASGVEVTRVDVGAPQSNVSFTPDGRTALVSVGARNEVVAIDMRELAVAGRVPTAAAPFGLVLLER